MLKAVEKVFKALADKNRLRILKMLQRKPMCVCEIREVLGLAQPTVSKHLKILKEAGLIGDVQEKLWTNYKLQTNSQYAESLLWLIKNWLKKDLLIKDDSIAAGTADRSKLCHSIKRKNR